MSLYLLLDLGAFIVPFVFSFHKKLRFYQQWKLFFPAVLLVGSVFVIGDIFFTWLGVWGFSPRYVNGIYLWGMPMEEYLFFFCIPYACVFTCHSFQQIYPGFSFSRSAINMIIPVIACLLILTGIICYHKWYTCYAFILGGISLLVSFFMFRKMTDYFLLTYLVTLLPFFIINGVLTGSFIEGEVVWYNDAYNLGVRLFTIPVEDFFYGMTLILWNINLTYRYGPVTANALTNK